MMFVMKHGGFANIVLIVLIAILVGTVGYFALIKKLADTTPTNESTSESQVLTSLKTNWQTVQTLIPFRPGHSGTVVWPAPFSVQFIGENNLLIYFEDGFNGNIAVLNFDGNKFKILQIYKMQAYFTLSDWQGVINKYGNPTYPISTYTMSLLRNGQLVSFQDLTKVPENVFVK